MGQGQHRGKDRTATGRWEPIARCAAVLGMLLGISCGGGPVSGVRGTPDTNAEADGGADQGKPAEGGASADALDLSADGHDAAAADQGAPAPDVSDTQGTPIDTAITPETAAPDTGPLDVAVDAAADSVPPAENDLAAEIPAASDGSPPDSVDAAASNDVPPEVALDTVVHEDEVSNVPGPVAACRQLVSTVCARDAQCAGQVITPAALALCEQRNQVTVGCDRATSNLFPACQQDTAALSCAALFTANGVALPLSCQAPLNIPISAAQSQCLALLEAVCRRAVACENGTEADVVSCIEFELDQDLPCQFAIDVTPNYGVCMTQIQAATCPQLAAGGSLPACATAVVLTP